MKKHIPTTLHLKKISFACVLISSVFFAEALTISPARLELSGDRGNVTSNEFTIINEEASEQTYYTSVENFEAQGESGTPSFTASKEGFPSWVKVADKITIKSGEKVKIPFTVTVPPDAEAGGHFAGICLSTIPPVTKGGEVSVGAKLCMLMLLKVNGEIKEDGGVMSFFIKDGSRFVTSLPITFVYRFNNNGNDRVKPVGTTTIQNMIGMATEELNANATEGNVLPKSIRRFEMKWGKEEALPASASFFSHVQYEMRNFALGLYFANLDISFGTKTASKSISFFVFPWHLLTVVVILTLLVLLVLRSMLKRYNNFIIAQARMGQGDAHETKRESRKKK